MVLLFAVWVLSANGQSTPLSHFSRVIFPYNLVPSATIWQGSTTHGEVALAKRNATLVTKMGIKRLFCTFWICATIFRPYFLDLGILKTPRKFKELHPLHPLKSGRNVISSLPYFSACTIVMALLPVRLLFSSGRLVVYLHLLPLSIMTS